jgi:hypothetical protein
MTLLVALLGEALADTITLESGATLEGTLTHYELHGKCNVHVEQGGLAGADVVLPCDRVIRMERVAVVQPTPTTLEGSVIEVPEQPATLGELAPVEEIAGPMMLELAPMMVAEDLEGANVGVDPAAAPGEPLPPAPAPEEAVPVAAVSPEPVAAVSPEEPAPAAPAEEPAPAAAEPVAEAEPAPEEKAEAVPEKKGPLAGFTWPKIRLD